jgi:hypothetical protein
MHASAERGRAKQVQYLTPGAVVPPRFIHDPVQMAQGRSASSARARGIAADHCLESSFVVMRMIPSRASSP